MEYIILAAAGVLFTGAAAMLYAARRALVSYTESLSECLDDMIAGKEDIIFGQEKETLTGRLQSKLQKLYEILENRASRSQDDRRMLEGIIADLSHQVKTPIAGIRMYHNLLQKEQLDENRRREFLDAVEHQVDKLEFLIQSMIKMSRLETGIVKVHPEYTPVYPLLEQAVCDIALQAETKEIEIEVECDERLKMYCDPKWTREAVFNLMDNAVKYTGKGGRVLVNATATDFFVRIRIQDNGKGIAEPHLAEIFKRFYREPDVAQSEGIGLGLYLVREILTREKGFVEVQSKEGRGSCFSVHLPIEEV